MSFGFPDGQRITQWLGQPLAQATALALGAGQHTDGPFPLASWASVVVAIKPTGGSVTVTIKQQVSGAPASLELDTQFTVQAGAILFESVVLFGDAVTVVLQGSAVGETVDYAVFPANTTTNAVATGGTGSGVTGDIVWSAAAVRSGAVLCDGTHYDGTTPTYAGLWGLLGLTFGGTSQADFAVPDLRDRVPVGVGINTARAANDGVAAANRHGTRHRHTPHTHTMQTVDTPANPGNATIPSGNTNVNHTLIPPSSDGGSGVAADPLDGPAFLGLNAFILL